MPFVPEVLLVLSVGTDDAEMDDDASATATAEMAGFTARKAEISSRMAVEGIASGNRID